MPVTCGYAPQTCGYRSVIEPVAVATYMPVTSCSACGGCSTCYQPVATVVHRTLLVPYTSYLVEGTACTSCGSCGACGGCGTCTTCSACEACPTGGCSTCASGACGMPIETGVPPTAGSGCASCGAAPASVAPQPATTPQSTYSNLPYGVGTVPSREPTPAPTPAPALSTPPQTFRTPEPTPAPKAPLPSALYRPIPTLPAPVSGINTGTQPAAPMSRSGRLDDNTTMSSPAARPGYYLISTAPKIASPAAVPVSATPAIVTLDDSGWRPARD